MNRRSFLMGSASALALAQGAHAFDLTLEQPLEVIRRSYLEAYVAGHFPNCLPLNLDALPPSTELPNLPSADAGLLAFERGVAERSAQEIVEDRFVVVDRWIIPETEASLLAAWKGL